MDGTFYCQKPLQRLVLPRWRSGTGVYRGPASGASYRHGPRELRTAMDLALRAAKVTTRSLGRAMSTMVVQERHMWLCLADMREADKARFLNAPVSQTGLFGDAVENLAQQFSAAQKQTEAIRRILPRCAAAASTRPLVVVPLSTHRRGRPPAAAQHSSLQQSSGYIGGFVSATSTVPGSLASASQPISLAPPCH